MEETFELAHIGLNSKDEKEAQELNKELCRLFGFSPRQGQKSIFAGDAFECMRQPYLGKNGHIAMRTPDLEKAVGEMKAKGFAFREDTAAYDENGRLKNIYLDGEFGGFAIHILAK